MDDLTVKWLRGQATDIEVRQLEHWRSESLENRTAYDEFIDLWNRTAEPDRPAGAPSGVVSAPPPLDGIIRKGDARRARAQSRAARRLVLRSPWTRMGLVGAAAAVLGLLFLPNNQALRTTAQGLFPVESSSSPSDVTTLGLSDGSVVRVMPETRVEFPATTDRREVVLEGRAFFAVRADPVPFVVQTRWGAVTVRGTRFEVLSNGEQLRVVVVEGRVQLETEMGEADLRPGQVAYLEEGSPPRVVDHRNVWSVLDWADGLLVYESTPLSMVVGELSGRFGLPVTLLDDSLGQLRITAWFEDETLEEVISALCLVVGTQCEIGETGVRIGR